MGHIPDMEILLAGGTTKPARDLKVGDKLDTLHQHTLERGEHEVTYVRVIESPLLSLKLSGKTFKCSEEDVFYSPTKSSWLKATELKKGDKVSQLDGELEVEGSEKLGKGKSVELTVNGAHTYVCDGMLLHNKGGGGGSPPPPPPKTYTQKEVNKMKEDWHKKREAKYDKRLAGQKELWGAQEAARKSDYMLQQRNLYDDRLKTAKGEWKTAADARYDARLGEARTGWHDEAEKRYTSRLGEAKGRWGEEEKKRTAATQAEFDKKYGQLQGQYDTQAGKYGDLQSQYGELDKSYAERGKRYESLQGKYGDLQGRYGDLQGQYDTRGQEYSALQGRYGNLQGKYDKTYADYGDLKTKYGTRGDEYDALRSKYDRGKKTLERERTSRRRSTFGEGSPMASTPGGPGGISSDAQRQALLTGDYSFMDTDKGRARGGGRDDSWRRYLG